MTEETELFEGGQLVPGTRYRVRHLIGRGGMGSVYEVEHVELGKRFVLKALSAKLSARHDLVARLRNEWRALGRLAHPSIVSVTDAGTASNGVPYYIMELLEGETLSARLARAPRLSLAEALAFSAELLGALVAAHAIGVVHRDIKPSNIMLVNGGSLKLLDFGIAKVLDQGSSVVTARGLLVGTPRYMSPEQAQGETVDGRTDLYAVGLVLFEMLAGQSPFEGITEPSALLLAQMSRVPPRASELLPGLLPELDNFIAKLLQKDPHLRPSSARICLEMLTSIQAQAAPLAAALSYTARGTLIRPDQGRPIPQKASPDPRANAPLAFEPYDATETSAALPDARSWNERFGDLGEASTRTSLERTDRNTTPPPVVPPTLNDFASGSQRGRRPYAAIIIGSALVALAAAAAVVVLFGLEGGADVENLGSKGLHADTAASDGTQPRRSAPERPAPRQPPEPPEPIASPERTESPEPIASPKRVAVPVPPKRAPPPEPQPDKPVAAEPAPPATAPPASTPAPPDPPPSVPPPPTTAPPLPGSGL